MKSKGEKGGREEEKGRKRGKGGGEWKELKW